jgi:lipoprotein-anchoring transpeptidase ErfK/SrfK
MPQTCRTRRSTRSQPLHFGKRLQKSIQIVQFRVADHFPLWPFSRHRAGGAVRQALFRIGMTGMTMLTRVFAGLAVAAGILTMVPSAFAVMPDTDAATAKATATAAVPLSAPAAEKRIAAPEPAKHAPARHIVLRPKPAQPPVANPWDLSRFFANAAAQWRMPMPYFYTIVPRTTVPFQSNYAHGTIVISTAEKRLYYVLDHSSAIRYGIGVGRPGFTWSGVRYVTAKREWPDWTPPEQMLRRKPSLPHFMKGGPDNPLGARAMYLGDTLYRIHGTNEPNTIGTATSSGCFRMMNDDVVDLYDRVKVGTMVVIKQN